VADKSKPANSGDKSQTSGNREESMKESGKDGFSGKQSPDSSGTTPLTGDSRDQAERTGPGGVEGETDPL
jgi:hypothetical protein